jgi:hypothetical protein
MGPYAGVDSNLIYYARVDFPGAHMGKKAYSNLCEKVIRQMRPETDSYIFFLNCLVRRGGGSGDLVGPPET